jgi:hypothetical protein
MIRTGDQEPLQRGRVQDPKQLVVPPDTAEPCSTCSAISAGQLPLRLRL